MEEIDPFIRKVLVLLAEHPEGLSFEDLLSSVDDDTIMADQENLIRSLEKLDSFPFGGQDRS